MKFSTYILYSQNPDKYYIGQSNNVERRLSFHNNRLNGYTKRSDDWKIVFIKDFETRAEAMKLEKLIKIRKLRSL